MNPAEVAHSATEIAKELVEAVADWALQRTIRDRPLASYQAAAHTVASHWVDNRVALASSSASMESEDHQLAVAHHAVTSLRALADDAVRLRGSVGYRALDVASLARLEGLRLGRMLGDPDALLERLGRPDRDAPVELGTAADLVHTALGGVWDDNSAAEADIHGVLHDWGVHRVVAQEGWLRVFLASDDTSHQRTGREALQIAEALALAGIPIYAINTTASVAALLDDFGSDVCKEQLLPAFESGQQIAAVAYTEPSAGSDLAGVRTTAHQNDDGTWKLDGTKWFCTLANEASELLVLARTGPSEERHKALTLFMVPASSSGISIRPIVTHGGEESTEVVLDCTVVTDHRRVGGVNEGWRVMMAAMAYERNASVWCDGVRLLGVADQVGEVHIAPDQRLADQPNWRRRVGELYCDIIVSRPLVDEMLMESTNHAVLPSALKLFCTERFLRTATALTGIVPADVGDRTASRRLDGLWRRAVSLTIAGGASEVQRDVVARFGVGLRTAS